MQPSALVTPEVTPATRLLEKRLQQFEADERLAAAKTAAATQVRCCLLGVPEEHTALLAANEVQGNGAAVLPCPTATTTLPPNKQEAAFRAREEGLKRRDLELQESLLRFTRFLQDNDAKRAKALRRADDEARRRGEHEAEIAALQAEEAGCRAQREAMQAQLAKVAK